jgi:hypothetical protein
MSSTSGKYYGVPSQFPIIFPCTFIASFLSPSHCTSAGTFAMADRLAAMQSDGCKRLQSARRPLLFGTRPTVRRPFNYSPCLPSHAIKNPFRARAVGGRFLSPTSLDRHYYMLHVHRGTRISFKARLSHIDF